MGSVSCLIQDFIIWRNKDTDKLTWFDSLLGSRPKPRLCNCNCSIPSKSHGGDSFWESYIIIFLLVKCFSLMTGKRSWQISCLLTGAGESYIIGYMKVTLESSHFFCINRGYRCMHLRGLQLKYKKNLDLDRAYHYFKLYLNQREKKGSFRMSSSVLSFHYKAWLNSSDSFIWAHLQFCFAWLTLNLLSSL